MKLKCRINGLDYDIVQGATFTDNFNETLDSGSICLDQVRKIDNLSPYDDVYIWDSDEIFIGYPNNGGNPLPSFFKHMLIDSFSEEMLALENDLYRYTINLFSETKKLEKIILPNISITQSLKQEEKRTCWFYLEKYIELYSPKYKKVSSLEDETWEYAQKYTISETGTNHDGIIENLKELFDSTICPEMSFTNPSLKDVLSQIMLVKDIIPFVKNDVIYGLDIGNSTGTFNREDGNNKPVNFASGSMSSANFATDARREYGNALSQENSARCVEYIGFRNPNGVFLDLENLTVQTRYPIYKINKFYICYYKKYRIYERGDYGNFEEKTFLCKQDITSLVLQNTVRNTLSTNWKTYVQSAGEIRTIDYSNASLELASKYKLCTVGYDIGSNQITGWGTTYEYLNFLWFQEKKTYIENIINLLENIDYYRPGKYGVSMTKSELSVGIGFDKEIEMYYGVDSIVPLETDGRFDNFTNKLKSVFFEIDYDAFYNGAINHSKDDIEKDDITTVDNCSSALTVLEIDGLQQKEKLDRLGNKIFKFTARYDDDNGGVLYSRVQNVGTYDEKTNSIVYMREYQVYDKLILANYESTYEYVLKNYFTSVWAKYRTYSLMSYGESVKRSENKRQLVLLSEKDNYFETENNNDIKLKKSLLSVFDGRKISTSGKRNEVQNINAGFFYFQEGSEPIEDEEVKQYGGYFLSDINSFACGNSLCFNISMEDNVSGGNYIKKLSEELNIFDQSSGVDYKTTQNWWQMPSSSSDAFTQNVGVYICHFDSSQYFAREKSEISDVQNNSNIRKFFDLPKFEYNSSYISNQVGNIFQLCKDNKEIIDFTFQFDFISKKNSNFFVSPWFCKLNDMVDIYEKIDEEQQYYIDAIEQYDFDCFIWNKEPSVQDNVGGFNMAIKISKDSFEDLEVVTRTQPFETEWEYVNSDYKFYDGEANFSSFVNSQAKMTLFSFEKEPTSHQWINFNFGLIGNREIETNGSKKYNGIFSYSPLYGNIKLDFLKEEGDFYWFKGSYRGTIHDSEDTEYSDSLNRDWYNNLWNKIKFWWRCDKEGSENVDELNSENSYSSKIVCLGEESGWEPITVYKNMYIFSSNKKIENYDINFSFNDLNIPQNMSKKENLKVSDVFVVGEDEPIRININADLFKNETILEEQVKSISYYYKDEKGLFHFVCGINLEQDSNGNSIFGNIPVYLSLIEKRDMTVYNSEHMPIGKATNYLKSEKEYGIEQYFDRLELLPHEYTKVKYLKGDGVSYVPTRIGITYDSSIEIECERPEDEEFDMVVAGSHNSSFARFREVSINSNEDECSFVFGSSNLDLDYDLTQKTKLSAKAGTFYINDDLVGGEILENLSPEVGPFNLFGLGGRNVRTHNKFNGKIYSCKLGRMVPGRRISPREIRLINKIEHILVPCFRNVDKQLGFYDIKTETFYPGVGDFKYEF